MNQVKKKTTAARGLKSCQKGQGLIEYIILVALVAVGSIGVVRVLGQTTTAQLSNITLSLQGGNNRAKVNSSQVTESLYSKKDLSDFMKNTTKTSK